MARKLIVEVVGDTKSLERAFDKSTVASKRFAGQMQSTGATVDRSAARLTSLSRLFAGGLAAGVAIRGVQSLTTAASDLNEQVSRSNQIFDDSARSIEQWSTTTASAIGTSQKQALEFAGTFGLLFRNIGLASGPAAQFSKELVKLGADMASFNNTSIEDALNAIRSGLTGEIEPLRRYGVFLSEARTQQEALANTGKKSADDLTTMEKVLARQELILRDTSKAQGDFARTSDGLANQQRILRARFEDTRAELGQKLLPAMVKVTEASVALIDGFDGVQTSVSNLASADFRQKFADVFGIEELRRVLGEVAPQLEDAQEQFVRDIQGVFAEPLKVEVTFEPVVTPGVRGFGSRLKPSDILGPKIKDIPKRLEEELLDAELAGDPKRIRAVLVKQREVLEEALDDPRFRPPKERIDIKERLKGIKGAIEGIDAETDAAIKAAAATRRANAAKADAADKKAAAEAKERLEKIRDRRIELAKQAAEILQARQFRAIGLSATGDQPIPGIENLRKQLASLADRTDLPDKFRAQFSGIARVLRGDFGKVTDATREAIRDFFQTVRGEFDRGAKDGPLTKTTSLNPSKLLDGLGLGRDMEKELRARLSSFNSAGISLAGATRPTGGFRGGVTTAAVPDVNVTMTLDGDVVARATTRRQQGAARRNPRQKTGPNSGI